LKVGDNGGKPCREWKGVHIPGCMGCAVYGHRGCTCHEFRKSDYEKLLDRLDRLEKLLDRLDRLEKRVKKLEGERRR